MLHMDFTCTVYSTCTFSSLAITSASYVMLYYICTSDTSTLSRCCTSAKTATFLNSVTDCKYAVYTLLYLRTLLHVLLTLLHAYCIACILICLYSCRILWLWTSATDVKLLNTRTYEYACIDVENLRITYWYCYCCTVPLYSVPLLAVSCT